VLIVTYRKDTKLSKKIRVFNSAKLPVINYRDMVDFQGDLKLKPSDEAIEKLKNSVKRHGVFVPKFVWFDKEGAARILDGHQTRAALESLEAEGYEIPKIPYLEVKARSEKDAAEKLLQLNSKYAAINPETAWFSQLGFEGDKLELLLGTVEIPELDIDKLLPPLDFGLTESSMNESNETNRDDGDSRYSDTGSDQDEPAASAESREVDYTRITPEQDRAMRPEPLEKFEPAEAGRAEQQRVIVLYEGQEQQEWLEGLFGVVFDRVIYRAEELMRGNHAG